MTNRNFKVESKSVAIYAKNINGLYIVDNPLVIKDGSLYHMWYSDHKNIYHTTSTDGVTWEERTLVQGLGEFIQTFNIIKNGNKFYMWYVTDHGYHNDVAKAYLATSENAINWELDGRPINGLGEIPNYGSMVPVSINVLKLDTTFYMWYITNVFDVINVKLLISEDGMLWNTVSNITGFEQHYKNGPLNPFTPTVIKDGERFIMFFTSTINEVTMINVVTSKNGIEWGKSYSIDLGNTYDSGVVGAHKPTIIKDSEGYELWYAARYYHGERRIHYAELTELDLLD